MIFVARVISVAMSTVRTLLSMRGQKSLATGLSFFESLLFILVVSSVLQDAGNVLSVLAYSGGFAAGTFLGLAIEERLALGYAAVQAISQSRGEEVASALRQAGYGVTRVLGEGLRGSVHVVTTVVKRKDIAAIMHLVSEIDTQAFVTIDDASHVYRGHLRPAQRPEAVHWPLP